MLVHGTDPIARTRGSAADHDDPLGAGQQIGRAKALGGRREVGSAGDPDNQGAALGGNVGELGLGVGGSHPLAVRQLQAGSLIVLGDLAPPWIIKTGIDRFVGQEGWSPQWLQRIFDPPVGLK